MIDKLTKLELIGALKYEAHSEQGPKRDLLLTAVEALREVEDRKSTVELEGFVFDQNDYTPAINSKSCRCREQKVLDKLGLGDTHTILNQLGLDPGSEMSWDVLETLTMWT